MPKHQEQVTSAPNAGRQSPEPETQSEEQVGAPTGTSGVDHQADKSEEKGGEGKGGEGTGGEDRGVEGLESNPTHPLEGLAQAKTGKEGRGEGI